MGQMIPELSEQELDRLESAAEAKLYRALRDRLPREYLVLFQVNWILRREDDQARDGEADFLIAHPEHGYICVEVKGGGVCFDGDNGHWYSIDRHNAKHEIKNPIEQALRAKYSILAKLRESPRWGRHGPGRIACGHAVFFPDINEAGPIVRADLPGSLIGIEDDLRNIPEWIQSALEYWSGDDDRADPIGPQGIEIIKNTFAHSFEVSPLVSARIRDQEEQRLKLTQDQLRVLDVLRSQRRVSISGGAGTGKTVLAVEKAKRIASEGFNTLLTCYNRQLADHLSEVCGGIEKLDVMSFHQLCYLRVRMAGEQSGRDVLEEAKQTYPGMDLFDVQYPAALMYSLDVVQNQYDAIVCDEGQDFREEYWFPIEMLLADYETSPLYIFFDDNQNVYSRARSFPIKNEPYLLVTNCRNTDQIHDAAYQYYEGEPVSPPGIAGEEIQVIEGTRRAQADRLHSKIVDLIARERVVAGDIVVVVADGLRKQEYYDELLERPLPRPNQWSAEGVRREGTVLLDTVKRFKGLESAIVFLWGLDALDLEREQELLYVGLSRAKSVVYVVASSPVCRDIYDAAKQGV
ncbi:MAG: NERD domain-containing protein [Candidatus Thiodiazotropha taylori]